MNIIVFEATEWGLPLAIADERAVHIREILKLDPGQSLRVGLLGRGTGVATYAGCDGKTLSLDFPDASALTASASLLPITLILGHPRPPVMQRLLKDLNAAGIARIFVVASDLSEKSYLQSRLWQTNPQGNLAYGRYLVQGAQQGGLAELSEVRRFYGIQSALVASETTAAPCHIMLDVTETSTNLLDMAIALRNSMNPEQFIADLDIVIAIGPERGWSDRERNLFLAKGFQVCSLGERILRTETACNLACGIIAMALANGD